MTRPDRRQNAALSAALAGAVDLSAVKARAEATARQQTRPAAAAATPGSAPAASGEWVVEVSETTFQQDVLERSLQVPVIVDLHASWSEESQQLSPVLRQLSSESNGTWILASVDIDANPRIAQAFGVQSVPMTVAIAGGQVLDGIPGLQPEAQLRQWIGSLIQALRDRLPGIKAAEERAAAGGAAEAEQPEDPRFTEAEDAFERGDYAAAEAAYEQILAAEPANEDAKAALAQVRFTARAEQTDSGAVAKADANPDDVDAQLAAADAEIAEQRVDEAFARLIATVRRTADEDRNRVRQHLVGLFELFPADDQRVVLARRNLASALF